MNSETTTEAAVTLPLLSPSLLQINLRILIRVAWKSPFSTLVVNENCVYVCVYTWIMYGSEVIFGGYWCMNHKYHGAVITNQTAGWMVGGPVLVSRWRNAMTLQRHLWIDFEFPAKSNKQIMVGICLCCYRKGSIMPGCVVNNRLIAVCNWTKNKLNLFSAAIWLRNAEKHLKKLLLGANKNTPLR